MITIQTQNFGVEIELTGITRQPASTSPPLLRQPPP